MINRIQNPECDTPTFSVARRLGREWIEDFDVRLIGRPLSGDIQVLFDQAMESRITCTDAVFILSLTARDAAHESIPHEQLVEAGDAIESIVSDVAAQSPASIRYATAETTGFFFDGIFIVDRLFDLLYRPNHSGSPAQPSHEEEGPPARRLGKEDPDMHIRTNRQIIDRKLQALIREAQELQALWADSNDPASGLTSNQRQVFQDIRRIGGTGATVRREIQRLLRKLKGDAITEVLVASLKTILKQRGLGIQCTCGQVAAPLWQRNDAYAQGGYLRYSHSGSTGRSEIHGGHTAFPSVTVVERASRRKSRTGKA